LQIITKSGQLHDIEFSTTPFSGGGKIVILGIMRDITERKNNEALRNEVAIANQTVLFKQNTSEALIHKMDLRLGE
jgi:hypothetical protein